MTSHLRRRVGKSFVAVLVSATLFGVAACGSSSEAETGDAAGNKIIRVANFGFQTGSAYLLWAQEGGYFEKHGIDVEFLPPMLNSADILNAVMNGDADVAITASDVVAAARDVGRPAKIVGATVTGYELQMGFQPTVAERLESDGLSEDSPLEDRVAALGGMTLGSNTQGSTTESAWRYVFQENGLDPEQDVTLQPLPDIASQVAALRAKRVDGLASGVGGSSTVAEGQGVGVAWNYTPQEFYDFPQQVVVAVESYVDSNPETIQDFLAALFEARTNLVDGLSQDDATMLKETIAPDMDQAIYDESMRAVRERMTAPFITSDVGWDVTLALTSIASGKDVQVPASEAIDNSFAEMLE